MQTYPQIKTYRIHIQSNPTISLDSVCLQNPYMDSNSIHVLFMCFSTKHLLYSLNSKVFTIWGSYFFIAGDTLSPQREYTLLYACVMWLLLNFLAFSI